MAGSLMASRNLSGEVRDRRSSCHFLYDNLPSRKHFARSHSSAKALEATCSACTAFSLVNYTGCVRLGYDMLQNTEACARSC
jgi:hypothetical protein